MSLERLPWGTALVTGAGGFIGSHLCELLVAGGVAVRGLVHYNSRHDAGWLDHSEIASSDRLTVIRGDVCDSRCVEQAARGVDVVFHLAALIGIPYSYVAPESYLDTNIRGCLNVLEACRRHGVSRLVHTSTSETYGSAQRVPMDESHPEQAQSPYAASKLGADKLALSYFMSFGLPVSVIRPFNTFGPRQSLRAVIPTIVTQALAGADTIHLGALHPVRDLTFVTDTARGFVAIGRSEKTVGVVTNVGNGKGISVGELASKILELCGSSARIVSEDDRVRPEGSEVQRLVCDRSMAETRCGWTPTVTLDEGLRRTIEFFGAHPEMARREYVV